MSINVLKSKQKNKKIKNIENINKDYDIVSQ